jgi:hypothetical protein
MTEDDVDYDSESPYPRPEDVAWDIRRQGRAWSGDEAWARWELTPEKFEMIDGKAFWDENARRLLLGLLLENVGIDAAIRLGDPRVWKEAIAEL